MKKNAGRVAVLAVVLVAAFVAAHTFRGSAADDEIAGAVYERASVQTVPLDLKSMAAEADDIVRCTVKGTEVRTHSEVELETLAVSCEITDVYKNQGTFEKGIDQVLLHAAALAGPYVENDDLILFLPSPSRLDLLAPLGIHSGHFKVVKGMTMNLWGNEKLIEDDLSIQIYRRHVPEGNPSEPGLVPVGFLLEALDAHLNQPTQSVAIQPARFRQD